MNKSVRFLVIAIALIAIAIIVGFKLYSNAGEAETEKALISSSLGEERLEKDLIKKVTEDLRLLEKAGSASFVEELSIDEDGTITYIIPGGEGLREEVKVRKESNGDVVLDIQEGDLYNELTITRSGKLFMNGKDLIVDE